MQEFQVAKLVLKSRLLVLASSSSCTWFCRVMQGAAVHSPERWDQTHMPHPGKQQDLLPGWGWGSRAVCELTAHFPFGYNTSFISIAAVPPGELKAQLSHHIELNCVYFLSIHFSNSISCCSNISLTRTSCYYRLSKAPC